ncbi:hypothetical protein [Amycolatopsis sp. cmx-4-61]|uniref:hypothetical protein n=1 Tax=Amycolatopsis sp. cmx-4-61 TaxID=2790937 RepID=UPI003979D0A6
MTDLSPIPVLNDLTGCERKVVEAARRGAELKVSSLALEQLAAREEGVHEVRAELLRELLLGRRGPLDPQGVRLIGLRIVGRLRLDQIAATAGISLRRCVVAEPIALTGSHFPWVSFQNCRLRRLLADGLQVDGDLKLQGTRISGVGEAGAVRLRGARVGGYVDLDRAEVVNDSGPAVEAMNTDGDLLMDIRDAEVATVSMPLSSVCSAKQSGFPCVDGNQVDLDRFTFGSLDTPDWREWLHLIRFHTKTYRPGPYQQLAAVERAAGHEGNARRILIRQQQDLHQRAPEAIGTWWNRRFHRLWGILAGYGYLARRTAGALLIALSVAGGLGLWAGHVGDGRHHTVERTTSFTSGVGVPCTTIELIGVGLDRGLPLSSTGVRSRCDFNVDTQWGGVFTAAVWLVQAAMWALATLALAGYTGLVRKAG